MPKRRSFITRRSLLTLYPGAAAAYSTRLLNTAYTGAALRVRRSNDNAEQDIGFANGNLDEAALTSFVGANSAFVTTWYDQSGNARNATQTTAANQPRIVLNGAIDRVNGKPALDWQPAYKMSTAAFPLPTFSSTFVGARQASGVFIVEHSTDSNNNDGYYFIGSDGQSWNFRRTNRHFAQGVVNWFTGPAAVGSLVYDGAGSYYKNGVIQANNLITGSALPNTTVNDILTIQNRVTMTGHWFELVIYPSAQTATRAAIESNIMSYFGITA